MNLKELHTERDRLSELLNFPGVTPKDQATIRLELDGVEADIEAMENETEDVSDDDGYQDDNEDTDLLLDDDGFLLDDEDDEDDFEVYDYIPLDFSGDAFDEENLWD
jgi:hypothetical protein